MAILTPNKNASKLISTFTAMTPYQVYLNQVKGAIETIRVEAGGVQTYVPPQLGGIEGQREVIEGVVVLQLVDFEVKGQ